MIEMSVKISLLILSGYIFGSIPFGYIICKIFNYGDIRKTGSGNIGATNVLRTGNKLLALLTLFLDSGKIIPIILAFKISSTYYYSEEAFKHSPSEIITICLLVGLGGVLGHCFPVWLKFKGGKGVATTLGVLLAAVPLTGLAACLVWLMSFLAARISSLAALSAMLVAPAITLIFYGSSAAIINVLISILVFIRHKDNIKRLMKGEEPRVEKKNTK